MDSNEYLKFARKEPIEALVHTYYASIGNDIKTSGKLHPNVFNWSFVYPSSRAIIQADYDHSAYEDIYISEIHSVVDERIAPILYEVLKKGERLIILYSTPERNIMYPATLCRYIESRYKLSIYKYKENELDRPYDTAIALEELKKRSKKAMMRKLIMLHPMSLTESEVKFLLKSMGIKPKGSFEDMRNMLMDLKREEIRERNRK